MTNMDKVKDKAKEEGQVTSGATQLADPGKLPISAAGSGTGAGAGTGTTPSDFERLIKAIEALSGIKTLTIQAPPLQPPASTAAESYRLLARDLRTVFQAIPDGLSNTTTSVP